MTTESCGHKKHTPITSEKQRGFFGAELKRKREGKDTKTDMPEVVLKRHLKESAGKTLAKVIVNKYKNKLKG